MTKETTRATNAQEVKDSDVSAHECILLTMVAIRLQPWPRGTGPPGGQHVGVAHLLAVGEGGVEAGESLPFGDETYDCVMSTWTMCGIPEVGRALGEVCRVLRSGGRLVFLEHGMSEDPKVQAWQRRLNPIEGLLGDGSRLDLDVEEVVRGQRFGVVEVVRFEMERVPRTHGAMYRGFGEK